MGSGNDKINVEINLENLSPKAKVALIKLNENNNSGQFIEKLLNLWVMQNGNEKQQTTENWSQSKELVDSKVIINLLLDIRENTIHLEDRMKKGVQVGGNYTLESKEKDTLEVKDESKEDLGRDCIKIFKPSGKSSKSNLMSLKKLKGG